MREKSGDSLMFARGSLEVLSGIYVYWYVITYFNRLAYINITRSINEGACLDGENVVPLQSEIA